MRSMMLVVLPTETDQEYGPTPEIVSEMARYNKELQDAGVLLALDGLAPPETGASVKYGGGQATVTDGPYAEAKEIVGGYWIIQTKTREEAIEWAKRVPMQDPGVRVDVRPIAEMDDYSPEVQEAAKL
jgi:hypothetical protein